MANQYIVTEHNVTPGTCRVMAQLKLSDMPGRDNGPTYRLMKQAGTSNFELREDFKEGTIFTIKGGNPVIAGKVYETLTLREQ